MSIKIGNAFYSPDAKILNLANCNFTLLPESIENFKNLKKLYLTGNKLTSLPESICNLSELEELHINCNDIHSLPQNINKLTKLCKLSMGQNNLTDIPESIYELYNLKSLGLNDNKIEHISPKIKNMKLNKLNLKNNKLVSIPFEIKNISDVYLCENSYQLDNLSADCEIIIIESLTSKLHNLPPTIKEIHIYNSEHIDIKLPFNCSLYVDGKLRECPV